MVIESTQKIIQNLENQIPKESWQSKQKALDQFEQLGLPTRHHDDWKYLDLSAYHLENFHFPQKNETLYDDISSLLPDIAPVHQLWTFNQTVIELVDPQGLFHSTPRVPSTSMHSGLDALHQALCEEKTTLTVPANTELPDPIYIIHMMGSDDKQYMIHPLQHIVVGENSKATVVELYLGIHSTPALTHAETNIHLKKGAWLNHIVLQKGDSHLHLNQVNVTQGDSSHYNNYTLLTGGQLNRSHLNVNLVGEHSVCEIYSLGRANKGQTVNHHIRLNHTAQNTKSLIKSRTLADRFGKILFDGKITVDNNADNTNAHMDNKNLHLSSDSSIYARPLLEIYNPNVSCSHGSTVGHIDEEQFFYLTSRGLERKTAQKILTNAHIYPIIQALPCFVSQSLGYLFEWN